MSRLIKSMPFFKKIIKRLPSFIVNPTRRIIALEDSVTTLVTHNTRFLPSYYRTNENIWLEGLLVDFLQKIIFDKWVRRFLVHSSYLVSERVLFDFVVRFYIDFVIWPTHFYSIFDYRSVANLLIVLLVIISALLISSNLIICYSVWFY